MFWKKLAWSWTSDCCNSSVGGVKMNRSSNAPMDPSRAALLSKSLALPTNGSTTWKPPFWCMARCLSSSSGSPSTLVGTIGALLLMPWETSQSFTTQKKRKKLIKTRWNHSHWYWSKQVSHAHSYTPKLSKSYRNSTRLSCQLSLPSETFETYGGRVTINDSKIHLKADPLRIEKI